MQSLSAFQMTDRQKTFCEGYGGAESWIWM